MGGCYFAIRGCYYPIRAKYCKIKGCYCLTTEWCHGVKVSCISIEYA